MNPNLKNNSSKQNCSTCVGCQLFKLRGKDESKGCKYYKFKEAKKK